MSKVFVQIQIIESVEKKIAGPFDDSFLADCAPLMTALLATRRGRRTKVNQAACSLWKSTFAHAQSLTYTAELRYSDSLEGDGEYRS